MPINRTRSRRSFPLYRSDGEDGGTDISEHISTSSSSPTIASSSSLSSSVSTDTSRVHNEDGRASIPFPFLRPSSAISQVSADRSSLIPMAAQMNTLWITQRRLQVFSYVLAEMSSASTLLRDYTRGMLNISHRLVAAWQAVVAAVYARQHYDGELKRYARRWARLRRCRRADDDATTKRRRRSARQQQAEGSPNPNFTEKARDTTETTRKQQQQQASSRMEDNSPLCQGQNCNEGTHHRRRSRPVSMRRALPKNRLRLYASDAYEKESAVARHVESLRATVVSALLRQFLSVVVEASYNDMALYAWLKMPSSTRELFRADVRRAKHVAASCNIARRRGTQNNNSNNNNNNNKTTSNAYPLRIALSQKEEPCSRQGLSNVLPDVSPCRCRSNDGDRRQSWSTRMIDATKYPTSSPSDESMPMSAGGAPVGVGGDGEAGQQRSLASAAHHAQHGGCHSGERPTRRRLSLNSSSMVLETRLPPLSTHQQQRLSARRGSTTAAPLSSSRELIMEHLKKHASADSHRFVDLSEDEDGDHNVRLRTPRKTRSTVGSLTNEDAQSSNGSINKKRSRSDADYDSDSICNDGSDTTGGGRDAEEDDATTPIPLSFFMRSVATFSPTVCACSALSRCVIYARNVRTVDDESPYCPYYEDEEHPRRFLAAAASSIEGGEESGVDCSAEGGHSGSADARQDTDTHQPEVAPPGYFTVVIAHRAVAGRCPHSETCFGNRKFIFVQRNGADSMVLEFNKRSQYDDEYKKRETSDEFGLKTNEEVDFQRTEEEAMSSLQSRRRKRNSVGESFVQHSTCGSPLSPGDMDSTADDEHAGDGDGCEEDDDDDDDEGAVTYYVMHADVCSILQREPSAEQQQQQQQGMRPASRAARHLIGMGAHMEGALATAAAVTDATTTPSPTSLTQQLHGIGSPVFASFAQTVLMPSSSGQAMYAAETEVTSPRLHKAEQSAREMEREAEPSEGDMAFAQELTARLQFWCARGQPRDCFVDRSHKNADDTATSTSDHHYKDADCHYPTPERQAVTLPLKLLLCDVGSITFKSAPDAAADGNYTGQTLFYDALLVSTELVVCAVRESRAHHGFHDAQHLRKDGVGIVEADVETLSDGDESGAFAFDRYEHLGVHGHIAWLQGLDRIEEGAEDMPTLVLQGDGSVLPAAEHQHPHQHQQQHNQQHRVKRRPLPQVEERQRRNERLKSEFRLARSSRLDALLIDRVKQKPIAAVTLVPYMCPSSPLVHADGAVAVQSSTFIVTSFTHYIAPLWQHLRREKALLVDLDRTLVDNAITIPPHAVIAMRRQQQQQQQQQDRADEEDDSKNSGGDELSDNAVRRLLLQSARPPRDDTEPLYRLYFEECKPIMYNTSRAKDVGDGGVSSSSREVIYVRPGMRQLLHAMTTQWNIPLILVTKSSHSRAHAILSQVLDPQRVLFTNPHRDVVTVEQLKEMKRNSYETDTKQKTTSSLSSPSAQMLNHLGSREAESEKRSRDILLHFDRCEEEKAIGALQPPPLVLLPRAVAIVDDAPQVWCEADWPATVPVAPYTLSRLDPEEYLSPNGYIASLSVSNLFGAKCLVCGASAKSAWPHCVCCCTASTCHGIPVAAARKKRGDNSAQGMAAVGASMTKQTAARADATLSTDSDSDSEGTWRQQEEPLMSVAVEEACSSSTASFSSPPPLDGTSSAVVVPLLADDCRLADPLGDGQHHGYYYGRREWPVPPPTPKHFAIAPATLSAEVVADAADGDDGNVITGGEVEEEENPVIMAVGDASRAPHTRSDDSNHYRRSRYFGSSVEVEDVVPLAVAEPHTGGGGSAPAVADVVVANNVRPHSRRYASTSQAEDITPL